MRSRILIFGKILATAVAVTLPEVSEGSVGPFLVTRNSDIDPEQLFNQLAELNDELCEEYADVRSCHEDIVPVECKEDGDCSSLDERHTSTRVISKRGADTSHQFSKIARILYNNLGFGWTVTIVADQPKDGELDKGMVYINPVHVSGLKAHVWNDFVEEVNERSIMSERSDTVWVTINLPEPRFAKPSYQGKIQHANNELKALVTQEFGLDDEHLVEAFHNPFANRYDSFTYLTNTGWVIMNGDRPVGYHD
jgi:hypothetical protein